jgi:hypothetical protein
MSAAPLSVNLIGRGGQYVEPEWAFLGLDFGVRRYRDRGLLSQFEKIREVRHAWRFSYESVELRLRLGQPLEHDVLLVPHFDQEIFDPREAVVDRAREGNALRKIVGLTVVRLCRHI